MPRRLWAILAVAFGVSLSVIDSAIANVALPTIGLELGISAADSIWIVNAYQLAIMVSLLSFSALGDVVGYRKVYIGGLMLFTVASVGCALSTSLPTLVLARVMQGFGAAAVTSVNTTLIRIIYPKAQLGRGMGINATVVAVSSVAGPTLAAGILSVDRDEGKVRQVNAILKTPAVHNIGELLCFLERLGTEFNGNAELRRGNCHFAQRIIHGSHHLDEAGVELNPLLIVDGFTGRFRVGEKLHLDRVLLKINVRRNFAGRHSEFQRRKRRNRLQIDVFAALCKELAHPALLRPANEFREAPAGNAAPQFKHIARNVVGPVCRERNLFARIALRHHRHFVERARALHHARRRFRLRIEEPVLLVPFIKAFFIETNDQRIGDLARKSELALQFLFCLRVAHILPEAGKECLCLLDVFGRYFR